MSVAAYTPGQLPPKTALGGGCHTALGAYATNDTLYLYHEDVGVRILPLTDDDFASPDAAAARILGALGLKNPADQDA